MKENHCIKLLTKRIQELQWIYQDRLPVVSVNSGRRMGTIIKFITNRHCTGGEVGTYDDALDSKQVQHDAIRYGMVFQVILSIGESERFCRL
jgi:hypothetical protein